ncbi:carbohydrate porin [Ruegeria marisrubri]|uniref:carbohydrate porin n=1 Tax=Ruegeria marisrubri TaxID=1685379 RepID=UPI001CD42E13|nr:carbohydrate porin [Ruegeria marisrubri]MCA0905704.1 carbohydrate porin [Ruegeria marisrubri]
MTALVLSNMAEAQGTPDPATISASVQFGNVEQTLERLDAIREIGFRTHFGSGPIDKLLRPFNKTRARWKDQYGLKFGLQYSPILHQSGRGGPDGRTLNDAVDVFLRWDGIVQTGGYKGSLDLFAYRRRDDYLSTNTARFNTARGALLGPSDANVEGSFTSVSQLSWESLWFDDALDITIGQLFLPALVDENDTLGNDRLSFMAEPLSNNPAHVLPEGDAGLGIGIWVTPSDRFYIGGVISQANANGEYPDFGAFDGDWLTVAELGWTPDFPALGRGHYRLTYTHIDLPGTGPSSSESWSFSAEQAIGEGKTLAVRAGTNDGNRNDIRSLVSGGVVFDDVLGYATDAIGAGAFWAEPDDSKWRDEYGVELFWRLQLTNSVQFTPDIQLWRPSDRNEDSIEAIVSFRLTISI